ncbi:TauD/TfdA family dioxygenase [Algoriphagus mannitolivorans]|uniref:TauD/TfdA family dioxygenase n=1 Tax=Algoriphagus mannitolivorans TaxID=226504 RepID=UPI0003FBD3AD|nr:TauD/TfdA family dioxygenase [Algoriphagus mannitolivorans]
MNKQLVKKILEENGVLILKEKFTLDDFEQFSNDIGGDFIQKEEKHTVIGGNSGRSMVGENKSVFTATGLKSGHEVPLHGELYFQNINPPDLLWFFCEQPGDRSDSTWYCDGVTLFESLSPETQTYLVSNNLATYHRYHPLEVWQNIYGITDPAELEIVLSKNRVRMKYQPEDGAIWTAFDSPILQKKGSTWAFINNILPFGVREIFYPDQTKSFVEFGKDIEHKKSMILEIKEVADQLTKEIHWEKGMLAIIDNKRTLHGRGQVSNFERKVFVRMSYWS